MSTTQLHDTHDSDKDKKSSNGGGGGGDADGACGGVTGDALVARTAAECAVAFDLEMWKAQQQAAFRAQLRKATAALEQRAAAERARGAQQHMRALDDTRAQLTAMAERLHAASAALRRRTAQLEAREAAFDARRVKVAEQHEAHLAEVEERARHRLQAAAVAQESAQMQLRERDAAVAQLQARLHAAEAAYDTLRRKAARHLVVASSSSSNAAAVSKEASATDDGAATAAAAAAASAVQQALEQQLSSTRAHVAALQRALQARDVDVQRLTNDKAILEQQLQRCVAQLDDVMDSYHQLRDSWHARERQLRRSRASNKHSVRRVTRNPDAADEADGSTAVTADDAARGRLLRQLQRDVRTTRSSGCDAALQTPAATAAAAQTTATRHDAAVQCAAPSPPPLSSPSSLHVRGLRQHDDDSYSDRLVQASSVHSNNNNNDSNNSNDNTRHEQHTEADVDLSPSPSLSSSSSSTSAYRTVEVDSWHSTRSSTAPHHPNEDDEDEDSIHRAATAAATDELSQLPPLAPQASSPPLQQAQQQQQQASVRVSPPLPQQFVQATQHGDDSVAATRADMRLFVEQLKNNRRKLLDTGVYVEGDAVVCEMSEKIRLYEQYLAQHL